MQHLVAGILRAMGYKTQVSAPGYDRGKDIFASPDGFGFEHPRIVVEVKHRKGQMGSQDIRSFLGGRHKDDRGLYVSTGGFTKDAQYEAERAAIPLSLWTLGHVVRALTEHYDATDAETKRIVPLKRLHWPPEGRDKLSAEDRTSDSSKIGMPGNRPVHPCRRKPVK